MGAWGLNQFTMLLALVLAGVWAWYYCIKPSPSKKEEHDHPWNRTWKPNPGFNDEFAGVIPGTCGQIRPGEWQCNCADQTAPCRVLLELKSQVDAAEKLLITDRRGAIAAQKARKRNGS